MLSTPERLRDPMNHAVPILDYFIDDENLSQAFMVMPLLRDCNSPPFFFVEEVIDFVQQSLEVSILAPFRTLDTLSEHCVKGNYVFASSGHRS